jgi:gluconokinase
MESLVGSSPAQEGLRYPPMPRTLVVMGVAGCGKSRLGASLAALLDVPLVEGDDFHSNTNKERMREGVALTDADRAGWLDALAAELQRLDGDAVLTCSALRRAYRDRLRAAVPGLRFVFIAIARDEAQRRVQARAPNHFFNPQLVDSQFETLEWPAGEADVLTVRATDTTEQQIAEVAVWLTDASRAGTPT